MKFLKTLIVSLLIVGTVMNLNINLKSKAEGDFNTVLPNAISQPTAVKNAKKQVKAARDFLKEPGVLALKIIKKVARRLVENVIPIYDDLNLANRTRANKNFIGIFAGYNKAKQLMSWSSITKDDGTSLHYAAAICYIGDLMGPIADNDSSSPVPGKLAPKLGLTRKKLLEFGSTVHKYRGGSAIAAEKKTERFILQQNGNHDLSKKVVIPNNYYTAVVKNTQNKPDNSQTLTQPTRRGVFNVAEDVNIIELGWPYQCVPTNFITSCPLEPWAGHYSGSIGEMLFGLDLLRTTNYETKNPVINLVHNESRECVAAFAAATIVGLGYHSAIEVKPAIDLYLGTNQARGQKESKYALEAIHKIIITRNDDEETAKKKCEDTGDATQFLVDLFAKCQKHK